MCIIESKDWWFGTYFVVKKIREYSFIEENKIDVEIVIEIFREDWIDVEDNIWKWFKVIKIVTRDWIE